MNKCLRTLENNQVNTRLQLQRDKGLFEMKAAEAGVGLDMHSPVWNPDLALHYLIIMKINNHLK